MSAWLQFQNEDDSPAPHTDFIAPLPSLGLIAATGEDAAGFLHNQLTNDVAKLPSGQARLAGYCSPKGRLLATFLMWKAGDAILLQLPRQIQAAIQKRLQMFVMRSKVKLADVSAEHVMFGLAGIKAEKALGNLFPELPASPYSTVTSENGLLIRVADSDGLPRYQWITAEEKARDAWENLTSTLSFASERAWRLSGIRAGIPQIVQATQEQFVPQMVNYELVGGVNFKKGCYPGQEIVARSQYLGKLKRRMMLAAVAAPDVAAGMEVFSSADPEQPCGMIVNAERESTDRSLCLVEMKLAVADEVTVHLCSASGPALAFQPLPYALPEPA
jgi:hypothetical protein